MLPNRLCIEGLRERQIAFVEWPTKGVRTPVRIIGPLGAVRLRSHDPRARGQAGADGLRAGARAARRRAGVPRAGGARAALSGAYDYRTRRHSTKLSEHAHGLAIDVHAFDIQPISTRISTRIRPRFDPPRSADDERVVEVERDFEPRVGKWTITADQPECIGHPRTDVGRLLRTLACRCARAAFSAR